MLICYWLLSNLLNIINNNNIVNFNANIANIKELVSLMKENNFGGVRKWVVENLDNEVNKILRQIYDELYNELVPSTIPFAILVIAKYQYQSAFCMDQEINLMACLIEIVRECEFL